MHDLIAPLVAIDGLGWLIAGVFIAGLVRGFSGFGTAMVYLPIAAQFLTPVWALGTMFVFDLFGPLPLVPRALKACDRQDLKRLGLALILGLPLGALTLSLMAADIYRYVVSLLTLSLLVLLIAGLRWRGPMSRGLVTATGALGGFLQGAVGLAGPPVIMLYMAATRPVEVIRANILLFLLLADILALGLYILTGWMTVTPIILGLTLTIPYMAGNVAGGHLFDPERESLYRNLAYFIIAASALCGLPIWS